MSLARCSAGPSPRGVRVPFGLLPRRAAALAVTGVPLAAPGLFVVACVLDISALTTGPGGCGASSPRAASRCAAGAHAQVRSFQLAYHLYEGIFPRRGVRARLDGSLHLQVSFVLVSFKRTPASIVIFHECAER